VTLFFPEERVFMSQVPETFVCVRCKKEFDYSLAEGGSSKGGFCFACTSRIFEWHFKAADGVVSQREADIRVLIEFELLEESFKKMRETL